MTERMCSIWCQMILSRCIRFTAYLSILLIAVPLFAQKSVVEAERFLDSNDIAFEEIREETIPACGGGRVLKGLDHPQEWTEYKLTVDETGWYSVLLRCRGDEGQRYKLRLLVHLADAQESLIVGFTFRGRGYGQ